MLDTVSEAAEDWTLDDIKGLLGRCNFRDDMLDRKVQFLSGGEKVMHIFSKVFSFLLLTSHLYNLYLNALHWCYWLVYICSPFIYDLLGKACILQVHGDSIYFTHLG